MGEMGRDGRSNVHLSAGPTVLWCVTILTLLSRPRIARQALFCAGCATSNELIKPVCRAVPFEPEDVLSHLQQLFHLTS